MNTRGVFKTDVGGTAGNAITLAENTGDTTISVSGATFLGGLIAGQEGIHLQADVDGIVMSGNTFTDVTNNDITFTGTTGGNAIKTEVVLSLDELALNGVKQARTNIATDYTNINDMIEDYLYDFVNGHAADKFTSGVAYRAPMQF